MSFWNTLRSHRSSNHKKETMPDLGKLEVGGSNAPRLNMNHGFIKSIVRNQIDRDEYDKLVSEKGMATPHREKPRKTCDPQLLYIPPPLRKIMKTSKNAMESPQATDGQLEVMRKEIRRRLIEQMAREEHERLQMSAEAISASPESVKKNPETQRRSETTPQSNDPLFKLDIRDDDGNIVERIVHANDNSARVAKALTRQLELNDVQCRLLRNQIEEELEKRRAAT